MYFHILSFLFPILLLFFIVLSVFYIRLSIKHKLLQNDFNKILKAIKRVRYGDINARVENINDSEFENAVNRLFETIYDREMMIKEYQSALFDKNLSLEEIIKNQKQLQTFKDDFVATLTHDMKVPVIAELNSINYLLENRFGKLSEKQTDVLKLMKLSNTELKELIENLVETYKLEKKTIELNLTRNNFNEFLDSVIAEMSPISDVSRHKIIKDCNQTKDIKLYFDFFQLKRVIKNLLHNAVLYSPNSTDISVKTELSNNILNLMITNKGALITEKDLELIFRKYYTGHSKLKKAGTGLGLYLSQQIMLAHNGGITVKSTDDGYTTFTVNLPM